MANDENFKVLVEGSALGVLHLMATKGIINLGTDRSLGDYQGEVHISSDPADTNVTLHINPGEGEDPVGPRPTYTGPRA